MEKTERQQKLFQLFTEIGMIEQLMTTEFNRRLPGGLLISHFGVINHMCRLGDGKTPAELASAFQVSKASMSNTLGKLHKAGLIDVSANPDDGRSKLILLTENGREVREQAIAQLSPVLEQLDQNLDLGNILKALPLLQELREYVDYNRDS